MSAPREPQVERGMDALAAFFRSAPEGTEADVRRGIVNAILTAALSAAPGATGDGEHRPGCLYLGSHPTEGDEAALCDCGAYDEAYARWLAVSSEAAVRVDEGSE
jgi:hypothetical protein